MCIVVGKDFEGEKETYSNAEWKERVEKWKTRQEKRGLVTKDDGGNDQGDDDDYLYDFLYYCLYIKLFVVHDYWFFVDGNETGQQKFVRRCHIETQ